MRRCVSLKPVCLKRLLLGSRVGPAWGSWLRPRKRCSGSAPSAPTGRRIKSTRSGSTGRTDAWSGGAHAHRMAPDPAPSQTEDRTRAPTPGGSSRAPGRGPRGRPRRKTLMHGAGGRPRLRFLLPVTSIINKDYNLSFQFSSILSRAFSIRC